MDMKKQIKMCVFISMIFILIITKFDVDINNDELFIVIQEHNKKKKSSLVVCSTLKPNFISIKTKILMTSFFKASIGRILHNPLYRRP
jgi:hypothetical protein